jgi:hypothetical protein
MTCRIERWSGCTPLQEGRLTIGRRLPACPTRTRVSAPRSKQAE